MRGKRRGHQRINSSGTTSDVDPTTFEYDGIDHDQLSPEVAAADLAGFEAAVAGEATAYFSDAEAAALESFDELTDAIHDMSKTAGDDWSPKKPEEKARVWNAPDEDVGRSVWGQLMVRQAASEEFDEVSSPTGVIMTASAWHELGGSISAEDFRPMFGAPIEQIEAIRKGEDVGEEVLSNMDLLVDYADVDGVDPYVLFDLPPEPFSEEAAGELLGDLHGIAGELGLEVKDEVPFFRPESFGYPVVTLHAIGVYAHTDQEIRIHPALPQSHKAVTLLHEVAHAHDFPQHSVRVVKDEMTRAEVEVDAAKCELVAEMATFAVVREMGGRTSSDNVVSIQSAQGTLMRLGEYDTESRVELAGRVAETTDFLLSRLSS